MKWLIFAVCLFACSRSERSGAGGPISRTSTVYVLPAAPDADAPPSPFTSVSASAAPPAPAMPFSSSAGRFRVTPPGGLSEHPAVGGILWDGRGVSVSVLFYDGKPRGVDRSPLYTA